LTSPFALGFNRGMTRTQVAERVAREAVVFVRKARRNGCVNMVTHLAFQEAAQSLGLQGDEYSMRTVKRIARENLTLQGEYELIGF
jgi:alanine racemase